jgi:magnesium transporter
VTGPEGNLLGVVTMRDLLLAAPEATMAAVMLKDPFWLRADLPVMEAMKRTVNRHYPCYPVCTETGRLLGLVWGHKLFAAQAIEISGQAGSMVGVDKEERATTPWPTCLKFRHPWLQLNLLTAFVAAAVVGVFEATIEKIVVLAVFLPVLAGQSGNTGCQALAVTLRGMTLGEFKDGQGKGLIAKEALLGLINGALVGITAGAGMYVYALSQKTPESPLVLGAIVAAAMTVACVLSGISGVVTPLALKRFGADPATASSIFLTTATDVASMGCFLGLATLWLL